MLDKLSVNTKIGAFDISELNYMQLMQYLRAKTVDEQISLGLELASGGTLNKDTLNQLGTQDILRLQEAFNKLNSPATEQD